MNAKIDRLTQKHKKLKRRYQTLQDDLYVEFGDQGYSIKDSEENVQNNKPSEPIETSNQDTNENNLEPQRVVSRTIKNSKNVKNGWRSQVLFL